ncbi:hypothetical protein NP05266_12250 [Helicobacter pylori]
MSLIDRGDYSIYGVKKVEFVSSLIKMHAVKSAKSRSVIYESRRYESRGDGSKGNETIKIY